jgi:curved DNA-binding protein CbpA
MASPSDPMEKEPDHYETLQISPNADPDTIHRVYRLLAQRYHPDNQETGDEKRFREINEAYAVLSDASNRASTATIPASSTWISSSSRAPRASTSSSPSGI